jgi:LPS sulfotransferase NodH
VSRAATVSRLLDEPGFDVPAPEGKRPMMRQAHDLPSDWVVRFRVDSEQQHQRI